jgi:DNA-directed RNA polymerase subunit delta
MKRVIVDYSKLTNEILNLLVERFPDGYDDSNIIRFRNTKNELIEAVEVGTEDTIYLVKVSTKLADRIENYDEDDEIDIDVEPIVPIKGLDDDDEDASDDDDDDEDDENTFDKPDSDEEDSDDEDDNEIDSAEDGDDDDED